MPTFFALPMRTSLARGRLIGRGSFSSLFRKLTGETLPRCPRVFAAATRAPDTALNEDLKKKGVQFAGAPEDRFYGVEAIMKDGLGNWFSMTQPKAWQG